MRSRSSVFVFVSVALVASILVLAPVASAGDTTIECDNHYVKVHHKRITVLPTGVDDTENLQCALDLATSMPWAHVRLVEGDYYTSFLVADGFVGWFRGAGKDKTTILTLPGGLDCVARFAEINTYPHLLTFVASKVALRDLTFAIGGDAPCAAPWESFVDDEGFGFEEWSIGGVYATTSVGPFTGECPGIVDHRFRAHRIGFESEFPDLSADVVVWQNLGGGVSVDMTEPSDVCTDTRLRGQVTVQGSSFSGHGQAVTVIAVEDSRVTVGGKQPWQANRFDDIGLGVLFAGAGDSRAVVMGNHINDVHWWGILGVADEYSTESSMVAAKNEIRAIDVADGIGVLDFGPETSGESLLKATIWANTIELVDTPFNGIFLQGSDDGRVLGNRISGTGETGIWLEGLQGENEDTGEEEIVHYSSGWYIANNKLAGLDPYFVDIFLNASTTENTVRCKCLMHEVLDEGIDNTIIGCTPFEEPSVPALTMGEHRIAREKMFGHPYALVQTWR